MQRSRSGREIGIGASSIGQRESVEENPGLRFAPSGLRALFLLDRDAALTDADVDAGRLLAILVEFVAKHRDGDGQRAEDQEQYAFAGHFFFKYSLSEFTPDRSSRVPRCMSPREPFAKPSPYVSRKVSTRVLLFLWRISPSWSR